MKSINFALPAVVIATGSFAVFAYLLASNFITNAPAVYCTSESCARYARMLTENLDLTTDPCESFYQFSCGNFYKNRPIEQARVSINEIISRDLKMDILNSISADTNNLTNDTGSTLNARKYFRSCLNES